MDFDQYMQSAGRLYYEAINSDVHPDLLKRLGGALAIAGEYKEDVWVEKNAYLGIIDRNRDYKEARHLAAQKWRAFKSEIERQRAAGVKPSKAVEQVMPNHGTAPHTPQQMNQMLNLVMGKVGTHSSWLYDIEEFRARIQRGGAIMGDTFGAITSGVYLIARAKDWKNATPEEWDQALDAGTLAKNVGQIAGAIAAPKLSRYTPEPVVGRGQASRLGSEVSNRPTVSQRAVRNAPAHAAHPSTASRGVNRSAAVPGGKAELLQARVDAAFSESSPYSVSELRSAGLQTHRSGPFAGQKYLSLDAVAARLSSGQMRAAGRLVGKKFSPELRAAWDSCDNARARADVAEVKRLWHSGEKQQARSLARDAYDRYASRFWTRVRGDSSLRQLFTDAGLEFEGGSKTAPFWSLPDGTLERLSIDHMERVTDAPWKAVDGSGMQFVPGRENSYQLEFIRNNDPVPATSPHK